MDKLKRQIKQKLIAGILIDKCAHSEYLIFREAWCTQERVIRFTTRFFRELFSVEESDKGKWKTGDAVMYEVHNDTDSLVVDCVLDYPSLSRNFEAQVKALTEACGLSVPAGTHGVVLHRWNLTAKNGDTDRMFAAFDDLIKKVIPRFEQSLSTQLSAEESLVDELREGAEQTTELNRYERNPQARAACLAAHGTACAICGIDFGEKYGPEFAGKIEVHHLVPISEIGEEYVVDPVRDLIPVCPNCHTALHSKKGGVYTPDELRRILHSKK